MKTTLMTAFALAACFFTTGCDEESPNDVDVQLAEMIEICEDLDGDCDAEIEEYLAAQDEEAEAANAGGVDGPDGLWVRPGCSHCGSGPIDDLTNDQRIVPHDAAHVDIDALDNGPRPTHQEIDALDNGPRPTHDEVDSFDAGPRPTHSGTPVRHFDMDALDNGVNPTHGFDASDDFDQREDEAYGRIFEADTFVAKPGPSHSGASDLAGDDVTPDPDPAAGPEVDELL